MMDIPANISIERKPFSGGIQLLIVRVTLPDREQGVYDHSPIVVGYTAEYLDEIAADAEPGCRFSRSGFAPIYGKESWYERVYHCGQL
jgi:hypothetical protein